MKYSRTKHFKFKLEACERIKTAITGLKFNTHWMSMRPSGLLTVKKGYAWDGSSVPLKNWIPDWLWNSDKYCKEASLGHDALCQAIREGLIHKNYKGVADRMYQRMCIEGGMPKWQADLRYRILRKSGDAGITPEKNPRNKIYDTEKE